MVWDKLNKIWRGILKPVKSIKTRFELIDEEILPEPQDHKGLAELLLKQPKVDSIDHLLDEQKQCLEIPGVAHAHTFKSNMCITCGKVEIPAIKLDNLDYQVMYDTLEYMKDKKKQFPHCDFRVLHNNFQCIYCDTHPTWQQERKDKKINFTGENLPGLIPCPSDYSRGLGKAHQWPGNAPKL